MKTVLVLLSSLFSSAPRGEVLEFTGDHCHYCRQVAPTVSKLKREGQPIRLINAESQPDVFQKYGVNSMPTFLVMVDGKEVQRVSGAISENELRKLCAKVPAAEPESPAPSNVAVHVELGEPTDAPRPRPEAGAGVVNEAAIAQAEPEKESSFPQLFKRTKKAAPQVRGQNADTNAAIAADDALLAASVRMQVVLSDRILQGSGTIIDSRPGRTVIATCGNLFAALPNDAKIKVDLPSDPQHREFVGTLLKADYEADVGVVTINTDETLPTAPLAAVRTELAVGDRVVSIGASEGKDLVREQIRVNAINKYEGPDNIECTGVPTHGRSGGGLFNSKGELVGICVANGEAPNSGVYAGHVPVYAVLQASGLSELCGSIAAAPVATENAVAATELGPARAMPTQVAFEQAPPVTAPTADDVFAQFNSRPATMNSAAVATAGAIPTSNVAMLADDDDQEVVVIVRSKKAPNNPSKVMVIHKASPKLMAFLNGDIDPTPVVQSRVVNNSRPAAVRHSVGKSGNTLQASADRRLSPPPFSE